MAGKEDKGPHPFARARQAVKRLPKGLTAGQRNVFFALLMHVNDKGEAHPGMDTLAEEAGMSDSRSARRAITALCKAGVVVRLEVGGGLMPGDEKKGRSSRYRIPEASEAAYVPPNETRTGKSGLAQANPDRTSHKPGPYKPQTRTGGSSEGTRRNIEDTRACAREDISVFLKEGLIALEAHSPDLAAAWGPKITHARLEGSALLVTTRTAHAAHVLRNDHAEDLLHAFAPANGVGRLVVEAIQ